MRKLYHFVLVQVYIACIAKLFLVLSIVWQFSRRFVLSFVQSAQSKRERGKRQHLTNHSQVHKDPGSLNPSFKNLPLRAIPFFLDYFEGKKLGERWYCSFGARSIGKAGNRRKLKAACRRQWGKIRFRVPSSDVYVQDVS